MISICRELLQHICIDFVHIWGYVMISGPWNPGFQDSRSALELASFDWYQHVGYESHSVYVKKLDFQHRISKFHHSWNFQKFSGTLDITWKWPIFWPYQCIGYFSHSFFGLEKDFYCRIKKFHHPWNLPGIMWDPEISLEMANNLLNLTHLV